MKTYSDIEIKTLYRSLEYVNGQKYFGELDDQVEKGSLTQEFGDNHSPSRLSLTIPVIEREERFQETFGRLTKAVVNSGVDTEIIIVENSLLPNLRQSLEDSVDLTQDSLLRVVYHYEPRLTLSTALNKASKELSRNDSEYL